MSLDVSLTQMRRVEVYESNITHNLNKMAEEAGIYKHLWRPEDLGMKFAGELMQPLKDALVLLKEKPEAFKAFNPDNGWGSYEVFVDFVEHYLNACIEYPDAEISVSR